MEKIIVENHRLRVTLPKEEFERIGRYGVFNNAMRMLGARSELSLLEKESIPESEIVAAAREKLVFDHLSEHCRYNLNETLMRMDGGHRMSPGMAEDVARAKAYADGVLSPISAEQLRNWYSARYEAGNEPNRRELDIQRLRAGRGINEDAEKILAEAAEELEKSRHHEKEYRSRFTGLCKGWDIEIIGEMPEQIGLCRYQQPGEEG